MEAAVVEDVDVDAEVVEELDVVEVVLVVVVEVAGGFVVVMGRIGAGNTNGGIFGLWNMRLFKRLAAKVTPNKGTMVSKSSLDCLAVSSMS